MNNSHQIPQRKQRPAQHSRCRRCKCLCGCLAQQQEYRYNLKRSCCQVKPKPDNPVSPKYNSYSNNPLESRGVYRSRQRDLIDREFFEKLRFDCERFAGAYASPPCSTVSRARHNKITGGPRPLRARSDPFLPLEGLTADELKKCQIGTHLFLACLDLPCRVAAAGGWATKEQPRDPGIEPFPSFYHSAEVDYAIQMFGFAIYNTDQCPFGAPTVKPTGLLSNDSSISTICRSCHHGGAHRRAYGRNRFGGFHSTATARYPSLFCKALAQRCLAHIASNGFFRAVEDSPAVGDSLFADRQVSDKRPHWNLASWSPPWEGRLFPSGIVKGLNSSAVRAGSMGLQQ